MIELEVLCKRQVMLREHSSFNIGGEAGYFAMPESSEELYNLLFACRSHGLEYFVFGMGTNLLFPDKPSQDRLFISLKNMKSFKLTQGNINLSAGIPMSALSLIGAAAGIDTLDFTFLLPGSLGAGIYMNARFFDRQISEIVEGIYYIDLNDVNCELRYIEGEKCEFSYKNSIFQHNPWIVVGADIRLGSAEQDAKEQAVIIQNVLKRLDNSKLNLSDLKKFYAFYSKVFKELSKDISPVQFRLQEIDNFRNGKKHFDFPSCGSVFKNNYSMGIPIGAAVEKLGLKGLSHGDAMISPYHGNFIINNGAARASDVQYLMGVIAEAIEKEYGIKPEAEVVIV